MIARRQKAAERTMMYLTVFVAAVRKLLRFPRNVAAVSPV
jgi:hypothetical protein